MRPLIQNKKNFKYTKSKPKKVVAEKIVLRIIKYLSINLADLLKYATINKLIYTLIIADFEHIKSILPPKILPFLKIKNSPNIDIQKMSSLKFLSLIRSKVLENCIEKLNFLSKILNFNSTKENKISTIIEKLDINIEVRLNSYLLTSVKTIKKIDNSSSFLFSIFSIEELLKSDNFSLEIKILTKQGQFLIFNQKNLSIKEMIKKTRSLKVYSYHILSNLLFIQFKNDKIFSWMFFHFSYIDLLTLMIKELKTSRDKIIGKKRVKEIITIGTFIAENIDFELVFSIFNTNKRVLYHMNSRLIPVYNLSKIDFLNGFLTRFFKNAQNR